MKLAKNLISITFLIALAVQTFAQDQAKALKKGETRSAEIAVGEKHTYTLKLDKGEFAFLQVIQKGVDLTIAVIEPNGDKFGDYDSPNGPVGPESIVFNASSAGVFRFELTPLNPDAKPGEYEIRVVRVEKQATTQPGRVDQIFAPWDNDYSPGATVSVVKDGEINYKKGYGLANLEYGIRNTPSTVFHIASVSKQFTAFAALLLEDEGKLSMDDDVRKYIPELHDFGKKITLRHLANHTSGLRDQWNLLALGGWRLDDVITRDHIMKLVARQRDLNFEPGAEYLYSNTGYTLLAEVVSRVSKKSFAEFTKERIFRPLGMKNTLFYDDHEKIVRNRAYSYGPKGNGYQKVVLSYANVGATSLFTTVEDLSLWSLNFEKPVVGSAKTIEKLRERGVLNNGIKIPYALGQSVGKYKGVDQISHGGGDAGYRTFLVRFPKERLSIVVFSNDGSFNPGEIAYKVADAYLESTEAKPPASAAPAPKVFPVPAATLDAYSGEWELQPGVIVNVTRVGGTLSGQLGNQRIPIIPVSLTRFFIPGPGVELEFIKGEDGKFNEVKWREGEQMVTAKRVEPFTPGPDELAGYAGRFYSDELETFYEFKVKEGKLIAEHPRHPDIEFTPVKKDQFIGNIWFFGRTDFVRDGSGKINSIKVTSGRVRNVVFRKNSGM